MESRKTGRKISRKVMAAIITAVILFIAAGGYLLWRQMERLANRMLDAETVCDQYVEIVLTALSEDDMETLYGLFPEGTEPAMLAKGLAQLDEIWAGRQEYEYKKTGIKRHIRNGNKTVACTYLITSGEEQFALQVRRGEYPDGSSALVTFVMNPVLGEPAGGPGKAWAAVQWGLRIFSILVLIATAATTVFCIRHQTRRKWLWVAGIMLLYAVGSLRWGAGGLQLGIAVKTPGFSRLIFTANGGRSISLYLPLGMILFWGFYRKDRRPGSVKEPNPEGQES